MTDERLAAVSIRAAIVSRDHDIGDLAERAGIDPDAVAYFLVGLLALGEPELERLTKALWGPGARLVHGRVRLAALP